jgi:hypothetical protein
LANIVASFLLAPAELGAVDLIGANRRALRRSLVGQC